MPNFGADFRLRVADALKLAEIGEIARLEAAPSSKTRSNLYPVRLEALYEMAYLRVFVSWEAFLEQIFLRYLCGYSSAIGTATPLAGSGYLPTLARAEQAVLSGNAYVLWHNPSRIVTRCKRFFSACTVETVVLSNLAQLEDLAAIRHRITHAQEDARRKFDLATMSIAGRRYRGARPGAFLRDWDASVAPPVRWLERLAHQLTGLAGQVA
jgi:hypothetical protein